MRKDGHYDALFSTGAGKEQLNSAFADEKIAKRINSEFFTPDMANCDQEFSAVLEPNN